MIKNIFFILLVGFSMKPAQAGWKKTVTVNGKTTVTGDAETLAQEEKNNATKAAYQKEIADAPRRSPNDPIQVTILNPLWDGKNKDENLERANKMLLDEFKNDPLLKVAMLDIPRRTGRDTADAATLIQIAGEKRKAGDVYLLPSLGTEAALGRRANGKLAVGNAIVYKSDIRSAYDPGLVQVKELGNLLQTTQMVKNVAKKSGDIIKNDIGPRLPSAQAIRDINKRYFQSALGLSPGDDKKELLKKLFKSKT